MSDAPAPMAKLPFQPTQAGAIATLMKQCMPALTDPAEITLANEMIAGFERIAQVTAPMLMLVVYDNDDGENQDLFVNAHTIDEAIDLWRDAYEFEDDEEPRKIFKITAPANAGVIGWNTDECECIYGGD